MGDYTRASNVIRAGDRPRAAFVRDRFLDFADRAFAP